MPSLEYNIADPVKREKEEKNTDKTELSRFKKLMEKGKEFMVKPLTWIVVGATVSFMACGDPGNRPEEDADQDTTEEVDGDGEVDAPDIPDVIGDDSLEVIDDETDVEDGEDAELPPLECEEPVEHIPPVLNPVFEANVTDSVSSTGGEINADNDLHMSMVPASYEECLNSGEGGYEIVCVGIH